MKIEMNKKNIAILLIVIVLFVMTVFDFSTYDTIFELIEKNPGQFHTILFIIYFISLIVTLAAALFCRYDIGKVSTIISMVLILILLFATVMSYRYKKFEVLYNWSLLFQYLQFTAWLYVIGTGTISYLIIKEANIIQ